MNKKIDNNINIILSNKICIGCGACKIICPHECIDMVYGKRFNFPEINNECIHCGKCLDVCPSSYLLEKPFPELQTDGLSEGYSYFLIHSTDDNIRIDSGSGGFATGLIIYLLKKKIINGAIVCKSDPEDPLKSISFIATTPEESLESRASRYTPVSSCIPLKNILEKKGKYIFVGKPCEIDALNKLINKIPELEEKIFLKIGPICAGTASRLSTKNFLDRYKVDIDHLTRIAYRGNGWPGTFRGYGKEGVLIERELIGDELKHLVPKDHYLRCHLCTDPWASYADISISDPWRADMLRKEKKGRTAIIVRNKGALKIIRNAISENIFAADNITKEDILVFQSNIVQNIPLKKAWLSSYFLIFRRKIVFFGSLFKFRKNGFKTSFKIKRSKKYYF